MDFFNLNDGHTMPQVGLGTYQVRGGQGIDQVLAAIQFGYRLLDTSTNYDSEGIVGAAIRRSGLPRSDFFVTTKLPGKYHHFDDALAALQESTARLGLDYLDLYLIHWPLPKRDLYVEAWRALIQAQKLGLTRSIGVSNFEPEHLDRIIEETGVVPAVNQIEVHPYWNNEERVKATQERDILVQAWSPFGRGTGAMNEKIVTELAQKYLKTPSQIILRWHLERGISPIPKSTNLVHIRENLEVFDFNLTEKDCAQLASLTRADGRVDDQDPNTYEEFD